LESSGITGQMKANLRRCAEVKDVKTYSRTMWDGAVLELPRGWINAHILQAEQGADYIA
jgi:hypothetical protein